MKNLRIIFAVLILGAAVQIFAANNCRNNGRKVSSNDCIKSTEKKDGLFSNLPTINTQEVADTSYDAFSSRGANGTFGDAEREGYF